MPPPRTLPPPIFLLLLLSTAPPPVRPQFAPSNPGYSALLSSANADLNATSITQADPALIAQFWPTKYLLPRRQYEYAPPDPAAYSMNVIFDPCRGYPFDCCNDTFGSPEFERASEDSKLDVGASAASFQYADTTPVRTAARRTLRKRLLVDETCVGEGAPRRDCLMKRVSQVAWPVTPKCWNWNESIVADAGCAAPADGARLPLCLALGYTQTAYVVDCGGQYAGADNCGTLLEVHRPGRRDVLASARLVGVVPSGYRMTVISTTYQGDPGRVLCFDPINGGRHEVWWVLRTLYRFFVQKRMPFQVISPICDWDAANNRYLPYASLPPGATQAAPAQQLVGTDPWDPRARVYTQPRSQSSSGFSPGKGMGATFVPPDAAKLSGGGAAQFAPGPSGWGNNYTYQWLPSREPYSDFDGVPTPSLDAQAQLATFYAKRGFRRAQRESEEEEGAPAAP
jgi:hypothetical protein